MQVQDLNEHQRALLDEAIEQAMISAAAMVLFEPEKQADVRRYVFMNPGCSAADALKSVLGDFAKDHVKYRPFEFNDFLASLEK
jgi:hypothetical protein